MPFGFRSILTKDVLKDLEKRTKKQCMPYMTRKSWVKEPLRLWLGFVVGLGYVLVKLLHNMRVVGVVQHN